METFNVLKEIDLTLQDVHSSDELVGLMKTIFGNSQASPAILSMPNFMSTMVPLNPKTICSKCKNELIPGQRCVKEYYLYSGPKEATNTFCRSCAKDVIDDDANIREKMKLN